jgi:hypothetical protein
MSNMVDALRWLRRMGDIDDIEPIDDTDDVDPADEFDPDDFADWRDSDTCEPGECPYDSDDYIDDCSNSHRSTLTSE